jgi:hypothetical protein
MSTLEAGAAARALAPCGAFALALMIGCSETPSETPCEEPAYTDGTERDLSLIPVHRRIEWRPGVAGGIPARTTLCATIDAIAFGDGNMDATDAIQGAIDACPEGQVVLLPEGQYRITDTLEILKGVVLRGEGPERSRIILDSEGVSITIRLGQWGQWSSGVAVTSGHFKGSTSVTVEDASGVVAGDVIMIDQIDDCRVATGDCSWYKRTEGGLRSVGQMVEVIAKDGDTLQLGSPLYYDYSANHRVQFVEPDNSGTGTVRNAGIEDLYLGKAREASGGAAILMVYAADSWVRNVESNKAHGRHIVLGSCHRCEVRDSYVHHAWNYNPGGSAYGISIQSQSSDCLIENNIVYYLNIPIVFEASGGGNVVAYNYVDDAILGYQPDWQMAAIGTHCSYPHMELVEGNWVPHIAPDNVHGGSGHVTFFRNYVSGKHLTVETTANRVAFDIEANNLFANVVGNVLWRPDAPGTYEGCDNDIVYRLGGWWDKGRDPCAIDARVAQTLFRHGNFDYVTGGVVWHPAVAERAIPASLYLNEKPAFMGDRRWPPVDPLGEPVLASLPAKERFELLQQAAP